MVSNCLLLIAISISLLLTRTVVNEQTASSSSGQAVDSSLSAKFNCCPQFWPWCFCKSEADIECFNLTAGTAAVDIQRLLRESDREFNSLQISPRESTVKLSEHAIGILSGFRVRNVNRFKLFLSNVEAFELTFNPFSSFAASSSLNSTHHNTNNALGSLLIDNSTFLFLFRGMPFDWICDVLLKDASLQSPLFASFRHLTFGQLGRNSYAEHRLCPIVFKNVNIESFYLSNLTLTNRPRFIQLSNASQDVKEALHRLNSNIRSLHIQSSQLSLDTDLLDEHVFKNLRSISLEFCNLSRLEQDDLFSSFLRLKEIRLWLLNFEDFIHSSDNDNKWMSQLNAAMTISRFSSNHNQNESSSSIISLSSAFHSAQPQMYIEFSDESNHYKYPDRDFCLFRYFPHENKVYPVIKSSTSLNCTCTLLFLVQNYRSSPSRRLETNGVVNCFRHGLVRVESMIAKCNFEARLKKCIKNSQLRLGVAAAASSSSISTSSSLNCLFTYINKSFFAFVLICFVLLRF